MTFEELIKKGKDLLAQHGIVESKLNYDGTLIEPRVPGLGASGDRITFKRNRYALAKYFIKTRILGEHFIPDVNIELFGVKLAFPILAAPMSGIKTNLNDIIKEKEFIHDILKGCKDVGTIGMCGDSFDTTSDYLVHDIIKSIGGIGVCKPREFDILKDRIEKLGNVKAIAVGIDLDGISGMLLDTGQVTKKNKEELIQIRKLFSGPMFLKGILSVEDAVIAYKAGFDAIVISNHGGRSIDYSLGTADILPLIAKKLKGKINILVDGGVKNGYDIFIYLALGADAVLVGRSILYSVIGGGAEGVKIALTKFSSELSRAMIFSGCESIKNINSTHIGRYE
ncbi:MAG: FMN-dependent alpha-hydroxy acid dehydrogenase [Parcubacteria group bacterium GW2011_GWA2_31_28]|nr:MAG: FMN-dependent alpha-hydroxy acid dehydrogenase [Parcubacteria group bacterium GW2011_GWA2_31_28]